MNIIFLDIDGVLNCQLFYTERYKKEVYKLSYWTNWLSYKTKYVLSSFKNKSEPLANYKPNPKHKLFSYRLKRLKEETCQTRLSWLNDLCKKSKCKIVISATMRKTFTTEEWNQAFKTLGFDNIEVIGTTDYDRENRIRGVEIKQWIDDNIPKKLKMNYVIIDDDSDMLPEQMSHLCLTDSYCGLTPTLCYRIERYFDGKYEMKNEAINTSEAQNFNFHSSV